MPARLLVELGLLLLLGFLPRLMFLHNVRHLLMRTYQYQHIQIAQRTSPSAPVTPDDATELIAPVSMAEGMFVIFCIF